MIHVRSVRPRHPNHATPCHISQRRRTCKHARPHATISVRRRARRHSVVCSQTVRSPFADLQTTEPGEGIRVPNRHCNGHKAPSTRVWATECMRNAIDQCNQPRRSPRGLPPLPPPPPLTRHSEEGWLGSDWASRPATTAHNIWGEGYQRGVLGGVVVPPMTLLVTQTTAITTLHIPTILRQERGKQ